MESNVKMIDIKGLKTPNFSEPKGDQFRKVMSEITSKVEEKRRIKNNSITAINKIKSELATVKNQIIMAEDEFEELELKRRRKALQEELESIEDYSDLDIDAYAKKLINKPEVLKLKTAAQKEYQAIYETTKAYETELKKRYDEAMKEINRFTADYASESNYRKANVRYNTYINQ